MVTLVNFYMIYANGSNAFIDDDYTNASGIAEIVDWPYPSSDVSGALAFYAEVDAPTTQKVISSPVMLNVGSATRFLVWIDHSESGTLHTIRGRLKSGEIGVDHKIVEIKVNETECDVTTTWPDGEFMLEADS